MPALRDEIEHMLREAGEMGPGDNDLIIIEDHVTWCRVYIPGNHFQAQAGFPRVMQLLKDAGYKVAVRGLFQDEESLIVQRGDIGGK